MFLCPRNIILFSKNIGKRTKWWLTSHSSTGLGRDSVVPDPGSSHVPTTQQSSPNFGEVHAQHAMLLHGMGTAQALPVLML